MPTLGTSLKVNYKGTYSSSITYNTNDIVYYSGTSYIALTTSTGQTPVAGTYWGLLASQGSAGAAGTAGTNGTNGTNGSSLVPIVKTAAYTAVANNFVLADATSAAFTVTLPAAPAVGTVVAVKKTDSSTNVVTVVGSGAATIDGDVNCTLPIKEAGAQFVFDGTNWQIQSTAVLNTAGAAVASTSDLMFTSGLYRSTYYYDRRSGTPAQNTLAILTYAPSTSIVYYCPQFLHRSVTIDTAMIVTGSTTAATAGSTIRLGAYAMNATTFYPGALLYDFGTVSPTAVTTPYTISGLTAVLPKGWFYWAFSFNSTAPGNIVGLTSNVVGVTPMQGVQAVTGSTAQSGPNAAYFTESGTGAALSANANSTPGYPTANVTAPNMWFRVA